MWHPQSVEDTMMLAYHTAGNPGLGSYEASITAARYLSSARRIAAKFFGAASPEEIGFTMNATQAMSLILRGLFHEGDHVITSKAEHRAVLTPLLQCAKRGVELSFLPVDGKGQIVTGECRKLLRPNTKAVVLTHGSGVTGSMTDLAPVGAFCRENGLLLVVDAAQTAGVFPIDVQETGIDILVFSGHKGIMGPEGTGGAFIRKGIRVDNVLTGEPPDTPLPAAELLEAGTPNVMGIAGLSSAILYLRNTDMAKRHHREMSMAKNFLLRIVDIPGLTIYGDPGRPDGERLPILSLNVGQVKSGTLAELLWQEGAVCVRAGDLGCPMMQEAFGTAERGMVRFSFSDRTLEGEVDQAAEVLRMVAAETAGSRVSPED